MKPLPTLILIILWPLCSKSQVNGYIVGRILDSDTRAPLSGASVSLVKAKDSMQSSFSAFTNDSGIFKIPDIIAGEYRIYATYLGYDPLLYEKAINVTEQITKLGDLLLRKRATRLREVEIIANPSPFSIRGDTIEYNADFYKTRDNLPLEELLKKLPGIEITPDGSIKINGQIVEQILVDGKPFFASDTKQATQNLLTKIIANIQVINQIPELTSQLSPSNNQKAINIVLRKDDHNKYSGSTNAGYGFGNTYSLKANLNRFQKNQQFSFIGGGNNVNDFENNSYVPNGRLQLWKSGVNFNTDINSNISIAVSDMWNTINSNASSKSRGKNILPNSELISNTTTESFSQTNLNVLSAKINFNLDTSSSLNLSASVNRVNRSGKSSVNYNTWNEGMAINDGTLKNDQLNFNTYLLTSINYIRKFQKPGHVLKLGISMSYNNISDNVYSSSEIKYVISPDLEKKDSLNQQVVHNERKSTLKINSTYSHPLKSNVFIDLFLSKSISLYKSSKFAYSYNLASRVFDQTIDSISGRVKNNLDVALGNTSIRLNGKGYDLSFGGSVHINTLNGWAKDQLGKLNKQYVNASPTVILNIRINQFKRIHFDYSQNVNAPDLSQMYVISDYNNPLYIKLGNPNLKPIRINNYNLNYNSVNQDTHNSFSILSSFTFLKDRILLTALVDSVGRQIVTPQNISKSYNTSLSVYNGLILGEQRSSLNTSSIISFEKQSNYINSKLISILKTNIIQGMGFSWHYKSKQDLSANVTVGYSTLKYWRLSSMNEKYLETVISCISNVTFPYDISFQSSITFSTTSGLSKGFNQSRSIANFNISRSIFRNKSGSIRFQCFDLLNRNSSVIRNSSANYIEDIIPETMNRFFMFSFVYYIN